MLITSDGSVGEISRQSFVPAEERIVSELKELGKPFAIVLNSSHPENDESVALAYELEEKYQVPVALVSCLDLDANDIQHILELVLYEFPVSDVHISVPSWIASLPGNHKIRLSVHESICKCADKIKKAGDIKKAFDELGQNEYIKTCKIDTIDLGSGSAKVKTEFADELYYSVLSELTGFNIENEQQLIELLADLSKKKTTFDRVSEALAMAEDKGYGTVIPSIDDLRLEEPEMVKQSGGYGVKLCASAQSIHLIRANIETEINPIVGTEQQSEDLVRYMLDEFEDAPERLWESNMFGRSLYELVNDGLHSKLDNMPDESRQKLSETLERIINEGSNGLICIIL
jgi:stage IV sporulation protein A